MQVIRNVTIINILLCNCRKTSWLGNIYKFDKSLSFLHEVQEKKQSNISYNGNGNMKAADRF